MSRPAPSILCVLLGLSGCYASHPLAGEAGPPPPDDPRCSLPEPFFRTLLIYNDEVCGHLNSHGWFCDGDEPWPTSDGGPWIFDDTSHHCEVWRCWCPTHECPDDSGPYACITDGTTPYPYAPAHVPADDCLFETRAECEAVCLR